MKDTKLKKKNDSKLKIDLQRSNDGEGCSTERHNNRGKADALRPHATIIARILELAWAWERVEHVAAPSILQVVSAAPPADLVSTPTRHVLAPAVLLNARVALGTLLRVQNLPGSGANGLHERRANLARASCVCQLCIQVQDT